MLQVKKIFLYYGLSFLAYMFEIFLVSQVLGSSEKIVLINYCVRFLFAGFLGFIYWNWVFSTTENFLTKYSANLAINPIMASGLLFLTIDYLPLIFAKLLADIFASLVGYFILTR